MSGRLFAGLAFGLLLLLSGPLPGQSSDIDISDAELDQALAPVALYPDALLSQILMASTYPLQIVEAARWSRERPGLDGADAVEAAANQGWDPSVQALVAFPDVLARMDQELSWTATLGDAVLMDEGRVLDRVQDLREQAFREGQLQSNDYVEVVREREVIYIEPREVHVVHVPYYDPRYVYGPWRHAAYPPVYWSPPPRYWPRHGLYWGNSYAVSGFFFTSVLDFGHRHVSVISIHGGGRSLRPAKSVRHVRSGHNARRWTQHRTARSARTPRGRDFRPPRQSADRRAVSTRRQDTGSQYQQRRPPSRLQSSGIRERRQQGGAVRNWQTQRRQAPNTARERHQQQFGRQQQGRGSDSRHWQQRRDSGAAKRGQQQRTQRPSGRDSRGSGAVQRPQRSGDGRQQQSRSRGLDGRQQRGRDGAQRERSFSRGSGQARSGGERRAQRGSAQRHQRQGQARSGGGDRRGSGR